MEEIWKKIAGFEVYEISNFGNVRREYNATFVEPNGNYRSYVYTSSGRKNIGTYKTEEEAIDARNNYVENHTNSFRYKYIKTQMVKNYLMLNMKCNGSRRRAYVHRLVAEAFIDNPNNYPVVNHIDYDTTNNRADNLEWCTQLHNVRHSKCNMHDPLSKDNRQKGEKYIRHKNGKYEVTIRLYGKRYYLRTNNLENAIEFRDKSFAEAVEYGKKQKNKSV